MNQERFTKALSQILSNRSGVKVKVRKEAM